MHTRCFNAYPRPHTSLLISIKWLSLGRDQYDCYFSGPKSVWVIKLVINYLAEISMIISFGWAEISGPKSGWAEVSGNPTERSISIAMSNASSWSLIDLLAACWVGAQVTLASISVQSSNQQLLLMKCLYKCSGPYTSLTTTLWWRELRCPLQPVYSNRW